LEKLDDLKGAEARYSKDLTLCRAKVNEFKISETKYESFAVVNIVLPWIDFKAAMISSWWSIIVFSAWSACLFKSQNVFLTVFLSNSISLDLNFNTIPSEIKYFIPGKETVNDISNLFGSLQKMKIPQVQSDIDLEVVNVVFQNV
jgi:hypothetical protein